MHVLVVDDEDSLLITLAANLELAGYSVTECSDPRRAVEIVRRRDVDLVLSDIRMPDMDGVEMFHAIRRVDPVMPVVLMTGFAQESLVDDAIQSGVFTVLSKPFTIDHVLSTVAMAGARPALLVVDAHASEADEIRRTLENIGLRCRVASDANAAATALDAEAVDVCLIDVAAGTSDVVASMRATSPGIAFIALASFEHGGLIRRVLGERACECIVRPLDVGMIVSTLARTRGRTALASRGGAP